MSVSIRNALPEDSGTIRDIAYRTWPVAYSSILSKEQLNYMLDLFYSMDSLLNQFNNLGHCFILVLENNIPAGFASFSVKSKDEPFTYRLHKLYVLPVHQGKGYGKILLNHIIEKVRSAKGRALELNVNRYNKAFDFYTRNGFVITREEDIDIGNGYFMNDYVMVKAV